MFEDHYFNWSEDKGEEAGGVRVLEEVATPEQQGDSRDPDDAERYAHWVDADRASKAQLTGRPVVALCGKVWKPQHNPDDYPICPKCQELYEELLPPEKP